MTFMRTVPRSASADDPQVMGALPNAVIVPSSWRAFDHRPCLPAAGGWRLAAGGWRLAAIMWPNWS
ncbi:MAG: hypothetical protein WAX14_06485 [Rhodococcus sp. (in: high G+C Gram-positive bacteria)]|uniref:hypothetical protein n=1 Tax=Rhodococcus sp. TaxID=1831 RepID=UPI003BB77739